jgi:methylglyoxal reductase
MTQMLREIGKTGIKASAVGLGTWAMGGWMWGGGDDKASIEAIQASLDEGLTLIDTAPAYGLGKAEELVGKAIQGRRDEVVLVTKCGLIWSGAGGRPFVEQDGMTIHRFLGPASIRAEIESSLRRLRTDHLDVYITHWQDPTTPIAETMETLLALKAEGKTRAIGISNASPEDLKAYIAAGQIDCIQEAYNMLDRKIEHSLIPTCAENGISVISYSSMALGLLTGTINPDRVFDGDDLRRENPRFAPANLRRIKDFSEEIAPITKAHGATTAQVVIAWTVSQLGISFALCGARNAEQALDNAKAGRLRLSSGDLAKIDAAAARHLASLVEV